MFEVRTNKTTFFRAPQSVTSLAAAFLEPMLAVLVFMLATMAFGGSMLRSELMLCLSIFALAFPGRNRFKDKLLHAGTSILGSWIALVAILWLCGYATNSLRYFEREILLTWALTTPLLQWLAVAAGRAFFSSSGRKEKQSLTPTTPAGASAHGARRPRRRGAAWTPLPRSQPAGSSLRRPPSEVAAA